MKKNIFIIILLILLLLTLTFGVYQKNRADKIAERLSRELLMIEENKKAAQRAFEAAKIRAEMQAIEARKKNTEKK